MTKIKESWRDRELGDLALVCPLYFVISTFLLLICRALVYTQSMSMQHL